MLILSHILIAGQVMGEELNVPASAWQEAVSGLHRRRLLALAAEALAGQYRRAVQANVGPQRAKNLKRKDPKGPEKPKKGL